MPQPADLTHLVIHERSAQPRHLVAVEYAKAVETEMNALLFPTVRRAYSKGSPVGRYTNIDGRPVDLGGPVPHQSLGTIIHALDRNEDVRKGIRAVFAMSDAEFILSEARHHLAPIAEIRNPAAHSRRLTRDEAIGIREQILGIGQEGLICRIARVKLRNA